MNGSVMRGCNIENEKENKDVMIHNHRGDKVSNTRVPVGLLFKYRAMIAFIMHR